MHWSIGAIIVVVLAFVAGSYVAKKYPGTIPYIN